MYKSFCVLLFLTFLILNPSTSNAETVKIFGSTGDGNVTTTPYPGTWADQHDDTVGRISDFEKDFVVVQSAVLYTSTGYLGIARGFLTFDTSNIPDNAEIESVSLKINVINKLDDFNDEFAYLSVLQGFQNSTTSIINADIDKCGDSIINPTKGSEDIDISNLILNEYQDFKLNASGLSWISKTGYTNLCIREGHDIENVEVVKNEYTGTWKESRIYFSSAEKAGTEFDPYLEIEYSVPEEETTYPLYTQIKSPYPSLEETEGWADDLYANGTASSACGTTIAQCGCVITSLVMSARNAGIESDILGGDVNPGNMNAYLESVSGYTSYGSLRWLAGQAYFGELTSGGKIASRFYSKVANPAEGDDVMALIDEKLTNGTNVVLGYKKGHYVWIPEKTADSYVVNDPWWYNTKTADDEVVAGSVNVRDYDNRFTDARIIEISDQPIEFSGSDIEVHLRGTAELLYTSATGEQVGYGEGGTTVIDLEHASYGDTEVISLVGDTSSDGKHLLVYEAGDVFTLEVIGTGEGEYQMEFFTISGTGEVTTFEFNGTIIPGVTTVFDFNLITGEVTERPITFEQFSSILDIQLEGYSSQQQKFFKKWAVKIFDRMEEKTLTQSLQSIEVYKKLLIAKKVDIILLNDVLERLGGSLGGE